MKHQIILVGDNQLFLEGLSLILGSDLSIVKCDGSPDLNTFLANSDWKEGVIVWDSYSVADHEIACWETLRHDFPRIGIVVVAQHIDDRRIARAIDAGVGAVLPKDVSARALKLSVRLVALGENVAAFPMGFSL